jgi:hypothetical protein
MEMKLSNHNLNTLMLFLQQKIEENAEYIANEIINGSSTDFLTYPPNGGLTNSEIKALEKLQNNLNLESALRKILADNSAGVLFELLNIIDGTSDPDERLGKWTEISFVDKTEALDKSADMLHDELYSKYWEWKKIRPNKSWKLDIDN